MLFLRSALIAVFSIGYLFTPSMTLALGFWVKDVTVVSPEREIPLIGVNVVIKDGRILKIGEDARPPSDDEYQLIDGKGLFLTPGLIDSHVHLGSTYGIREDQIEKNQGALEAGRKQEPLSYLFYGFTNVVQINSGPEASQKWAALPARPDMAYCVTLPWANGYGMAFESEETRFDNPYFLYDEAQADGIPGRYKPEDHTPEAVVKLAFENGASCVKVFYEDGFSGLFNWPVPTVEAIREVVKEAHARGIIVLLHATSFKAHKFGVEAGVDVLAHGLWHWDEYNFSETLTPEIISLLDEIISRQIGFQPTARVIHGEVDLFQGHFLKSPVMEEAIPPALLAWYKTDEAAWFKKVMQRRVKNNPDVLRKFLGRDPETGKPEEASLVAIRRLSQVISYLAENGGNLLLASDTPSSPAYTNPIGLNSMLELGTMWRQGLTPRQVFEMATINNAQTFGLDDEIGTIEEGKKANLLLLAFNPLEKAFAYDSIEKVFVDGKVFDRADLSAQNEESGITK